MRKPLAATVAVLALFACSESKNPVVQDATGGSGGTAGSGGTGGTGGSGGEAGAGGGGAGGTELPEPPRINELERLGGYLPARANALLAGVETPVLITGYKGVFMGNAAIFGLADPAALPQGGMAAGLSILDTTTGTSRLYTTADGLPMADYADTPGGGTVGAAPIFDLAWLTPDVSFAAAAWSRVMVGSVDAEGAWSFRSTTVRAPGRSEDAIVITIGVLGDEIFAGTTDQGVAVLDAETLTVDRWLDLGGEGMAAFAMTRAVFDEPVLAIAANPPEDGRPKRIGLYAAGATAGEFVTLPEGSILTDMVGTAGAIYIGAAEADLRGVIYAVVQGQVGRELVALVPSRDLAAVHGTTMTPNRIALDEANQRLLLGATMKTASSGQTPGVVAFDLVSTGEVALPGRTLVDRRRGEADLLPWQTEVLTADAHGRVYVDGVQRCNESSARPTGVFRIENIGSDPDDARLVRPWVSGVRSIAVDPVEGHTWLGLRDENPGLACDGYTVQTSICRLKNDGSCEIYVPPATSPEDEMPALLSAARITFGDPARRELAIATWRNATWLRMGDTVGQLQTQYDPGTSLEMTAAAWGESGLWLASTAMWHPGVPDDGIDWEKVNDRSPHGLGYLELSDGVPTFLRRYSRNQSDSKAYDLAGMPSNHAQDVIPLPGTRHALVALGAEREMFLWDHALPEANGVAGGVVEVLDEEIHAIEPPEDGAWTDVVGLAKSSDGTFYALDATEGVVTIDLETRRAHRFAEKAWGEAVRPTALAADGAGHVAVGTTSGLYVYGAGGGVTRAVSGRAHGTYWALHFLEDGVLYAGADQGLVRVAIDEAGSLPSHLGPSGPLPRTLWPLEVACDGELGCHCISDRDCVAGSVCECAGDGCVCAPPPERCELNPGDVDCACVGDDDCLTSLRCVTDGTGATCQPDDVACMRTCGCPGDPSGCPPGTVCQGGVTGQSCVPAADSCLHSCGCDGGDGCPATWHCDAALYAGRCIADYDPCLRDCSCAPSPCLDGYVCDESGEAPTCVLDPDACLADCSCGGATGCPGGYLCQGGIAGSTCVEDNGAGCEADCSCTGGNPDGCPAGMFCLDDGTTSTCVEEPDPCLQNCTCPDNPDGCQDGYYCQGGIAGNNCLPL